MTWSGLIRGEKKSFELIPIGVKWPIINNEKKVIRITWLDMKKIHLTLQKNATFHKTDLIKVFTKGYVHFD
jgi:hypothetical protein